MRRMPNLMKVARRRVTNTEPLAPPMNMIMGWEEMPSVFGMTNLEVFGKDPNLVYIYKKDYLKVDVLDDPEGGQPTRSRGKPVSPAAEALGAELAKNYECVISGYSDESTASVQAAQQAFGCVSRLGMWAPTGNRTGRRDAYTVQLEERVKTLSQESTTANERIASLEASQRDMQQFLAQLMASQQGSGGGVGSGSGEGSGGHL